MNQNAKILFGLHLFWAFVTPLSFGVIHVNDFIRFGQIYVSFRLSQPYSDPCDYLIPVVLGFHVRIVAVLAIFGEIFTMLTLAMERIHSTLHPARYEQSSSAALGISLAVGQVG